MSGRYTGPENEGTMLLTMVRYSGGVDAAAMAWHQSQEQEPPSEGTPGEVASGSIALRSEAEVEE